MSQGARNWPFFTLTTRPVFAAAISRSVWRQRKAGICRMSTASAAAAHCAASCTSVSTGQSERGANLGEDRQRRLEPDAARAVAAGAVRLVERGLVDEANPDALRHLLERLRHLQRMGTAFELARTCDQRERQIVAEARRADIHNRVRDQGLIHHCSRSTMRPGGLESIGRASCAQCAGAWVVWLDQFRGAVSNIRAAPSACSGGTIRRSM